ncbi:hypothetical protein NSP_37580 [Nodularia spumigena CCY9414]|nr:hypothetical protein NSP_37580 [Nodularia spumigena CCY9414]
MHLSKYSTSKKKAIIGNRQKNWALLNQKMSKLPLRLCAWSVTKIHIRNQQRQKLS